MYLEKKIVRKRWSDQHKSRTLDLRDQASSITIKNFFPQMLVSRESTIILCVKTTKQSIKNKTMSV